MADHDLTAIEIKLATAIDVTDTWGDTLQITEVTWQASRCRRPGEVRIAVTARAEKAGDFHTWSNATRPGRPLLHRPTTPGWVPDAPGWFWLAVAAMKAQPVAIQTTEEIR
ncbi:hypothetical protein [Nocardioides bruguierae]|uniref:Uncharacterized protein n=1 Tax=Nocardioides bruguierae TaxID=2945102 RepID=A0A9X2IFU3_9ACTN|nr:hypothetical protein [Nocardioides bruguierae]MCM0622191.1 hypothetical protein [Nocardioides bruguierae]